MPTNADVGQINVTVTVTATDSGNPPLNVPQSFAITVVYNRHPRQNPTNPLDTDGNGTVWPGDALLLINHLNTGGAGLLDPPLICVVR
jgi:hypothetical protein